LSNDETEPDDDVVNNLEYIDKFEDVSEDDRFSGAVNGFVRAGLLYGVSDDHFAPDLEMTSEMFVTVPGRLHGINIAEYCECNFEDVDMNTWHGPYVAWSADAGITK